MSMDDFLKTLNEEQKAALLKALTDNKSEENTSNKQENFTSETIKKPSNNRRREPVKARKNEWVDTGEFKDYDTKYGDRVPRQRKPFKKVDIECSVCGRSFKADPKFVYGEYHRCSKCVGK
jgi:methylase of polypeptide subunit release factors